MKPVIIGAGLAGLSTALALSPSPVILLAPQKLGADCASSLAQGGIAVALGADDTPALHAADTIKAGASLCDPSVARSVTADAPDIVKTLAARGVGFDRDAEGHFLLGLEGGHSRRRIVHAADSTGKAIMQALIKAARKAPSIDIIEDASATDLLTEDNAILAVVIERNATRTILPTNRVVLATGGAGALWRHTTNPPGAWGHGLALAARAGAVLGDLEFMQFHPTAIDTGGDPMPLASEALRGEGCTLIDERGERFTDELQPRDVVARAMVQQIARGHRIFLDARAALGENFAKRFPAIHALCAASGIDPAKQPIPVRPAAHYHMGGVVTDARGRTSIDGLWACGEVTDTRLHGANRLASNSLLEAAAFGARVAEDITGVGGLGLGVRETLSLPNSKSQTPNPSLRDLMSRHAGIIRHREGLETLIQTFLPQAVTSDRTLAGLMIAVFALKRAESRGAHRRSDYPQTTPQATRQTMTLTEIMQIAESCIEAPPRAAAGGL